MSHTTYNIIAVGILIIKSGNWVPFNRLDPAKYLCAYPKPRSGYSTSYDPVVFMFN